MWMALKHRGEEFQIGHLNLNVCGFFGGGLLVSLCSPSTCPQNWFAVSTVICALKKKKKKAVGYQRLYRTTSPVFFSPTPPAHHQHHHTPHWSYQHFGLRRGMVSARPVRSDCRLISQLRRCARLCGKGDYCLLSVFVARSAAVCSATRPGGSRDNSEVWLLTFYAASHARKKKEERSGINFTTTARKFKVWNIRIDDSQRTEDDIHIGLQRCSKGVSDSQLQHQNDYIFIYVLLFLPVLSPSSRRVRRILPRPADVRKTSTFFFFRRVKQCLNMTRSYCTTLSRRCVIPGDAPFL